METAITINSSIFFALKVSEKSGIPVLFMGNPGVGKTTSVKMFAELRGYEMILLRGSQSSNEEILGYEVFNPEVSKDTAIGLNPTWLTKLMDFDKAGKKCLLFLDEITTANSYVQGALFHLIFDKEVGSTKLPDSTLIVAAGNYSGNLSAEFNLLPPLMNRFCIVNIIPSDEDIKLFLSKYKGAGLSKKVNSVLDNQKKSLSEMNNLEPSVDEDLYYKIVEKIEIGTYKAIESLKKGGKHDFKVTDMQNLYADTDQDNPLPGLITMRSMGYVRDIAIGSYLSFGPSGLMSPMFHNMINGLVGVGLTRDSSGKPTTTSCTQTFIDIYRKVSEDISRLSVSSLGEYEKGIINIVGNISDPDDKIIQDPEVINLNSLITKMSKDDSIRKIESPIGQDLVRRMCDIITNSARDSIKLRANITEISGVSPEEMNGSITRFNNLVTLFNNLDSLIKSPGKNYPDEIIKSIDNLRFILRKLTFNLTSKVNTLISSKPEVEKLIIKVEGIN